MASSADRSVTAGRAVRLCFYFAGALVYAAVLIMLALWGAVVGLVWDLPRWMVMKLRYRSRANLAVDGLVMMLAAFLLWALVVWIVL